MFAIPKVNPLVRAVLVVGGVAGLVTGVTLATHNTATAEITESTVTTASENLHVSTTSATVGFSNSVTGFSFTGLIPGGDVQPEDGFAFWLKNDGGTNFGDIELAIPTAPVVTGDLNLTKVHLTLTDPGADGVLGGSDDAHVLTASFDDLATDTPLGLSLSAGSVAKKLIAQVSMDADAFTTETASVTSFDLEFNGVAPVTAP